MAQPKEALTGATKPITISGNAVVTPPNQTMGNSDIAQFTNTSSAINATVTFLGAARYAFGNNYGSFSVPSNNGKVPLTPHMNNLTVNYTVGMGVILSNTYSIEIGTGPLEIDITDSLGSTNIPASSIGNNGTFFFRNLTSLKATITFPAGQTSIYNADGTLATSQVILANSPGAVLTGIGTNQFVTYTIAMTNADGEIVGTGTKSIKVGQT